MRRRTLSRWEKVLAVGARLLAACAVLAFDPAPWPPVAVAQPAVTAPDDLLPTPLADAPGDVARGRALVTDRRKSSCLLCHSGPFPEERFQGDLAPDLAGAGARWTVPQLRLRIAASRRLNADSIMPSYARSDGFHRVAAPLSGRPILTGQEIEDIVAFLATLK